jgi:acyl-CoA synthetase (AMP-forming)/AMP-acid ligase II/acyl carrier protein
MIDRMPNLFDAIATSCLRQPDRRRLTFLRQDGQCETVTGSQLLETARALAGRLLSVAEPGDRVLLAYPAGLEFVSGLLACLRAGLIPVPVNYPKPRRPFSRYAAIASQAEAHLALTSRATLAHADRHSLEGVRWFSHDELLAADAASLPPLSQLQPGEVAFLQFTSGSTSEPKGVVVSHENLAANLAVIRSGFQIDQLPPEQRVVCSWLPLYHDMGLVGVLLASLVHDGHAVMMAPTSFLRRPADWLAAITQHAARITVAPCFGYSWAVEQVTDEQLQSLDLSSLELAACGAEPIFPQVLEDFARRFSLAGFRYEAFYPCYGLAESTLMVTGTDRGGPRVERDGRSVACPGPVTMRVSRQGLRAGQVHPADSDDDCLQLVSSGVSGAGTEIVLVDEVTGQPVAEDRVGEIWVHSPSVARGYWQDREHTEAVFGARLPGDRRRFLRTGDLGFRHGGQLYVTGRTKDLIILGGQNHFPQDIERSVQQSDSALTAHAGAAFSVCDETTERLVIVQEVPRDFEPPRRTALMRTIRLAVAREHEVTVDEIVLIRPAALPRTSSGKVRRSSCRQLYRDDELKQVERWKHRAVADPALFPDLSQWIGAPGARETLPRRIEMTLLRWLVERTGQADVRADQAFAELGIESLTAVELSQQLEAWLGVRLSPVAAWSYPNPRALAKHLAELALAKHLAGSASGQAAAHRPQTPPRRIEDLVAEIESLDEASVEALLRQTQ